MSVAASPDSPIERIRQNLVALRMPRALEALDGVVRQLERGATTPIKAIDTLLAEELTVREGRRIKAALQMARLATVKTLAGFDFSFQPSLDRNRIMALASLDFIDKHEVVHLIGQSGTGKSHLAIALGVEAVNRHRGGTPIGTGVPPVGVWKASCIPSGPLRRSGSQRTPIDTLALLTQPATTHASTETARDWVSKPHRHSRVGSDIRTLTQLDINYQLAS